MLVTNDKLLKINKRARLYKYLSLLPKGKALTEHNLVVCRIILNSTTMRAV